MTCRQLHGSQSSLSSPLALGSVSSRSGSVAKAEFGAPFLFLGIVSVSSSIRLQGKMSCSWVTRIPAERGRGGRFSSFSPRLSSGSFTALCRRRHFPQGGVETLPEASRGRSEAARPSQASVPALQVPSRPRRLHPPADGRRSRGHNTRACSATPAFKRTGSEGSRLPAVGL